MAFYTNSSKQFGKSVTGWLQDTRLLSEAVYRLNQEHNQTRIALTQDAWPKQKASGGAKPAEFTMTPKDLATRMDTLDRNLWAAQFIFLESLWEEYIQGLLLELGRNKPTILRDFVGKDYMSHLVEDALAGSFADLDELTDAAVTRFASAITRESFGRQWRQLERLGIGLNSKAQNEKWYENLDVYFEMRNCIVHRRGRISTTLNQLTPYYKDKGFSEIRITPDHLDFYRGQFLECINYIENHVKTWAEHNG